MPSNYLLTVPTADTAGTGDNLRPATLTSAVISGLSGISLPTEVSLTSFLLSSVAPGFTVAAAAVNNAPVAGVDTLTVQTETVGTINVLLNDTDADDDTLTVTTATSPDGTVGIGASPTFILTFTSDVGFTGATTITYTVSDGNGGTDTGTVNVTVTAAATGTARNVTTVVGAQTFSGVVIEALTTNTGSPLTGVSATGGTASSGNYALSASGVLTVASNGSLSGEHGNTITFTSDQGDGTITLDVDNSQFGNYTVNNMTEVSAAFTVALGEAGTWPYYNTSGPRQIIMRDGNYAVSSESYFKNRKMTYPLTFRSLNKNGAVITQLPATTFDNGGGFIFDNLLIRDNITCQNASTLVFRRCEHFWQYVDPDADWSVSPGGPTVGAINGANGIDDLTVEDCHIHGWGGGVIVGEMRGPLLIKGCRLENIFEDSIKIGGGYAVTITDNFIESPVAPGNAFGDPHADPIQLLGAFTADWTDVTIHRNIVLSPYTDRSNQGIFLKGMGAGYYYTADIQGNLLVNRGASSVGIRLPEARDCVVKYNTVVSFINSGSGNGPGIDIGETRSAGTHIVTANATNVINLFGGSGTLADNVTFGNNPTTTTYQAAFDGTNFMPTTRAEALAEFRMKIGGTTNLAVNAGAVGTGYVNFPTTSPGSDGSFGSDTSIPTIVGFSPIDDAEEVAINAPLTISFSKNVQFGTDLITLYDVTGAAVVETFDVETDVGTSPGQVNIVGNVLTIYPTNALANSNEYARQIAATAIEDLEGRPFAGVTDITTISFTTVAAGAPTGGLVSATTGSPEITRDVDIGGVLHDIYIWRGPGSVTYANNDTVDLALAGKGSNGGGRKGGGGAAGEWIKRLGYAVTAGTYPITVDDISTTFDGLVALAGGTPGSAFSAPSNDGGSGGGGGSLGSVGGLSAASDGIGNDGGAGAGNSGGGGGGGAGSAGANANGVNSGGNGGASIQDDITGTMEHYCAGAGGFGAASGQGGVGGTGAGNGAGGPIPPTAATRMGSGGGGGSDEVRSGAAGAVGGFILRVKV